MVDTQTHNPLPESDAAFLTKEQSFLAEEDAKRFNDLFTPFTVSGGTHDTAGGLVGTPSALLAYPGGFYVTETGSITYNDNKTNIWVICHKDTVSAITDWTRVAGTHYLFEDVSATEPTIPADSLLLMRVVTSGGAITTVEDKRLRSPLYLRTGNWNDYTNDLSQGKVAGANVPTWSTFRDGLKAYAFSASSMNEVWVTFHVLHDIKIGEVIFPHVHWSPGSSTNTGTVRWGIECTHCKGHQQQSFPASITMFVEQAADGTAFKHYIAEVAEVDVIPALNIEPDTLVQVRVFRDAADPNDTFPDVAFGLEMDLHYLQAQLGTLNKEPDFFA